MNFSAEEYTRQVQEAAAYIKEKLGGRAQRLPSHSVPAWVILPIIWLMLYRFPMGKFPTSRCPLLQGTRDSLL